MAMRFVSPSPEATEALGAELAEVLRPGVVVALEGPVGVGKSVLARGALRRITGLLVLPSPTFTLVWSYPGDVHHVDLYRLREGDDAQDLAEFFEPPCRTFVEWPERAPWLLPEDHLWLTLRRHDGSLELLATATGPESRAVLAAWGRRVEAGAGVPPTGDPETTSARPPQHDETLGRPGAEGRP